MGCNRPRVVGLDARHHFATRSMSRFLVVAEKNAKESAKKSQKTEHTRVFLKVLLPWPSPFHKIPLADPPLWRACCFSKITPFLPPHPPGQRIFEIPSPTARFFSLDWGHGNHLGPPQGPTMHAILCVWDHMVHLDSWHLGEGYVASYGWELLCLGMGVLYLGTLVACRTKEDGLQYHGDWHVPRQ
jgi:hypothetical protein